MRAQNDFLRGPPLGCGAFRFEPVAALYLARPLAVKPAPLETGSFSPRPTAREGFFLAIEHRRRRTRKRNVDICLEQDTFAGNNDVCRARSGWSGVFEL
jgi:hypothetical protein